VAPHSVDYDLVAHAYDKRYSSRRYEGVAAALHRFISTSRVDRIAEVGCGTGHWLIELQNHVALAVGLDPSGEMLRHARASAPSLRVVRGRAENLPWSASSFDRLFCVNALHHFTDPTAFLLEARRALEPGGGVMTVGLDPHTGADEWWIYDHFPSAIAADRARYPSTTNIREWLLAAGFTHVETTLAEHIRSNHSFESGVELGLLDRQFTSQLMVISDAEYEAGVQRLRSMQPALCADLRLYATVGWVPTTSG
jgi:ubiquinone/menaquinone biosynthesis C-methylase UbiE